MDGADPRRGGHGLRGQPASHRPVPLAAAAREATLYFHEMLVSYAEDYELIPSVAEPTFVNQSFQVDLTTSYDISDNFSVFAEALNVNNNQQSTHGRYSNQLLDVFDYGRRYTLGLRYRY